jgi:L-cysteine/cystine lyase
MNTGWQGPPPNSVTAAVKERLEYESETAPTSPAVLDSGKELKVRAREAAANLLNASVDEIALTQNTTHGLAIVLAGLPWEEGDEVITFDIEHNAVLLPALNLGRRFGVKTNVLSLAPNEAHETIADKVEQAITERTRLVFFSHIQYATGLRMPVEAIRNITSQNGVWMLLDGAQTPGHIKLDMQELGVDFYSIPGQKWLLGPQGTGALYIRESAIPLVEPVLAASQFLATDEDRGGLEEPNHTLITKFNLGTTSPALAAGFEAGIKFIQGIGDVAIEERNQRLALDLKIRLSDMPGITVYSPFNPDSSSGLVTFAIDGSDPESSVEKLWNNHHIVGRKVAKPAGIRLALDFFNTEEEIDIVCEAIRELSEGR